MLSWATEGGCAYVWNSAVTQLKGCDSRERGTESGDSVGRARVSKRRGKHFPAAEPTCAGFCETEYLFYKSEKEVSP